jgi:hypothetical protein
MLRRLIVLTAAAGAAGFAAYKLAVGPWYRDWGADPDDALKALPGDDLVAEPTVVDTRAIEIAAPPAAVWPWLVQMGYGRAGWYSYDAVDRIGKSVDEILPEWQTLPRATSCDASRAAVRPIVEPERALVVYLDGEMVEGADRGSQGSEGRGGNGAIFARPAEGAGFLTDFAASWAMVPPACRLRSHSALSSASGAHGREPTGRPGSPGRSWASASSRWCASRCSASVIARTGGRAGCLGR